MLRAILFDFDGVLADSEPIHLAMFQKILSEEGISLSQEDYYEKYLGLDDRGVFEAVFKAQAKALSPQKEGDLIRRKNQALLAFVKGKSLLLPGAAEFVEKAAEKYFLAVVSGALKSEIVAILSAAGLVEKFHVIVAADDVSQGKPSPEGFQKAFGLLNRDFVPESEILLPEECLVIEDSPWGIEAAHAAGMKCVGVLTSYAEGRMGGADLVVRDTKSLSWDSLSRIFPV